MSILDKASRVEFPKGSKVAYAQTQLTELLLTGIATTFALALRSFEDEFGRPPDMSKVIYRGAFTSNQCIVEICEVE